MKAIRKCLKYNIAITVFLFIAAVYGALAVVVPSQNNEFRWYLAAFALSMLVLALGVMANTLRGYRRAYRSLSRNAGETDGYHDWFWSNRRGCFRDGHDAARESWKENHPQSRTLAR